MNLVISNNETSTMAIIFLVDFFIYVLFSIYPGPRRTLPGLLPL